MEDLTNKGQLAIQGPYDTTCAEQRADLENHILTTLCIFASICREGGSRFFFSFNISSGIILVPHLN